MLNILHIAYDEKFIDRGLAYFHEDERVCNYLLIVSDASINEYVTTKEDYRLMTSQHNEIADLAMKHDVIVLHSLPHFLLKAVERIERKYLVWLGFGFDYYDIMYKTKYHLMMAETRRFYIEKVSTIEPLILEKQIAEADLPLHKIEVLEKINLFCPVLKNEYEQLENYLGSLPEYFCWNYISEESEKIIASNHFSSNRSVIVGNSADPSNNHIDVLNNIKNIHFGEQVKIITPLSYGNNKYANEVERSFTAVFGNSYRSLRSFMNLQEYCDVLATANTCIMAHKRQQAMGNIAMMLRLGYRIFMNKQSPAYSFFTEHDIQVFPLEVIEIMKENITEPLDRMIQQRNAEIMFDMFSAEKNKERTKNMIDKMFEHYGLRP